ncbi:MAG: polyphenol oxidase family protein [Desulfobacterales bacterium]
MKPDGSTSTSSLSCEASGLDDVWVEGQGLVRYRFPRLACEPGVRHGIFTRHGGVSRPPFHTFNLAKGVGDRPSDVDENRRRLRRAMGGGRLVLVRQVHGITPLVVRCPDPEGFRGSPGDWVAGEGDAVITDCPGLWLTILVADCQAVLLWDPDRRVVANIHAGWRGSVGNIAGATIVEMTRRFGTDPRRLVAGIGPSLGPCCAEFIHYRSEIPRDLWRFKRPGSRFDFWEMTRYQLARAGVAPERISTSGICTRCGTDLFFSYRAERTTGRFAAVIGMDPTAEPGRV